MMQIITLAIALSIVVIVCFGFGYMLSEIAFNFSLYFKCKRIRKNIKEGDVFEREYFEYEDNPFERYLVKHTVTILEIKEDYARYEFKKVSEINNTDKPHTVTITRCESLSKMLYERQLYLYTKVNNK